MIIDIVMPKMGESITEGTILEWKKEIGEFVEMDEILLEIGTDKVDSEIPSPAAGKIIEIIGKPNDVFDVGAVIARVESVSDQLKSSDNKEEQEKIILDQIKETPSKNEETIEISKLNSNKDENNFSFPVVFISVGNKAIFNYGSSRNNLKKIHLSSGSVVVLKNESRLYYHSISKIYKNNKNIFYNSKNDSLPKEGRISVTLRRFEEN